MPDATQQNELLKATVKVPMHVVFRSFPSETVVLNLQTGKYHGLNPTGGRIIEVLQRTGSVSDAAATVAQDYELPLETAERDVCALCASLLERGLVEIDGSGAD